MEEMLMINTSSLRMKDVTTTAIPFISVRNTSVSKIASNAYEWRFILPAYFLIFILSISGNCLVIATLTNNRRMRTVTNVYLLNLAISDFLLGVFCLPFTLVGQVYRRFLFGAVLCKLIPFLQAVSVSVGVWTLVAISLERYFAICRPLKSRKWQTQCHAYKMIATVWLLSIALNSPILLVSTLQPMRGNAFKCREMWSSLRLERAFNLGLDAALLLVPFFIMSFAYSLIVTKLWRGMKHEIQHNFNWQQQLSRQNSCKNNINNVIPATPIVRTNSDLYCKKWNGIKKSPREPEPRLDSDSKSTQAYCMHSLDLEFRHVVRSTHIDKSIEAKRKVIRMLFVIIMEFFICWAPLHVINTIYLFYPDELYQYIGTKGVMSLQLLAYCSSCCNPITYCFMNRKFRQAFIGLFKNCRLFRGCFRDNAENKQVTPPPVSSSQDVTACVIRGSHTGRTAHRLRTGHMPLKKFAFLMGKSDTPNCETCGVEEDVYHLLVECVRLQRERRALEVTYQLNRLDVGQFNRLLTEPDSDAAKELFDYRWTDWKGRIVFSSGSQSTAVGSGVHPALPAPVVTRPITQVIETGEEGSQFLYRITWARTGQHKSGPTQPLYE